VRDLFPKRCRECGSTVSRDVKFCPHCGVSAPTQSVTALLKTNTAETRLKRSQNAGLVAGLLGCLFGAIGILTFFLPVIFVPLAAFCAVIGLVRGIGGGSAAGIGTSLLAGVLSAIGFVVSPSLWLLVAGLLVASNVDRPTEPTATTERAISTPSSIPPASIPSATANGSTAQDYVTVSALTCKDFLEAYGTERGMSLSEPIVDHIYKTNGDFGSAANITDYVAIECRMHEQYKIGTAVEELFKKERQHSLPQIPIGGATADPKVHAQWDAFDKWLHHNGPRPAFLTQTLAPAAPALPHDSTAASSSVASSPAAVSLPFVVAIETSVSGGARPLITGMTNLPDGTQLYIWLKKPWLPNAKERLAVGLAACGDDCFPLQTKVPGGGLGVVVTNGQFSDGPFTDKGAVLRPGTYVLEVSFDFATLQSSSVRAIIGQLGENMTGPLVGGCCFGSHMDQTEIQETMDKQRRAAPILGASVYYARYVTISPN
jgi:hypothetical protein